MYQTKKGVYFMSHTVTAATTVSNMKHWGLAKSTFKQVCEKRGMKVEEKGNSVSATGHNMGYPFHMELSGEKTVFKCDHVDEKKAKETQGAIERQYSVNAITQVLLQQNYVITNAGETQTAIFASLAKQN
jgi:hypothetical protein